MDFPALLAACPELPGQRAADDEDDRHDPVRRPGPVPGERRPVSVWSAGARRRSRRRPRSRAAATRRARDATTCTSCWSGASVSCLKYATTSSQSSAMTWGSGGGRSGTFGFNSEPRRVGKRSSRRRRRHGLWDECVGGGSVRVLRDDLGHLLPLRRCRCLRRSCRSAAGRTRAAA